MWSAMSYGNKAMKYGNKLILSSPIHKDGTRDRILGSRHAIYVGFTKTDLICFHLREPSDVKVQVGRRFVIVNFREGSDLVAAYKLLRQLIVSPDGGLPLLIFSKILLSSSFLEELEALETNFLKRVYAVLLDPKQAEIHLKPTDRKRTLLSLLAIKNACFLVTPLDPEEAIDLAYATLLESNGFSSDEVIDRASYNRLLIKAGIARIWDPGLIYKEQVLEVIERRRIRAHKEAGGALGRPRGSTPYTTPGGEGGGLCGGGSP